MRLHPLRQFTRTFGPQSIIKFWYSEICDMKGSLAGIELPGLPLWIRISIEILKDLWTPTSLSEPILVLRASSVMPITKHKSSLLFTMGFKSHSIKNTYQTQVSWPSGWALGLKVLVPSSIKCASQFESGYLHFEKSSWASNLPHYDPSVANSN